MRLDDFPRYRLIHAPTPLEPLERLQKFLGGPKLYVKRDDCAGLAFGGNKSRKLEFLLGEALQTGATTLITDGGLQSNHARQTAAAAAKAGLKCHLVLADNVQIKGQTYRSGGNVLLDRLLGADIHFCTHGDTRVELIERLILELQARGDTPFYIPTGGSSAIGALGYVSAMLELLEQAERSLIKIDRVVVASVSGGTQAGLLVGNELAQAGVSVTGVHIGGDPEGVAQNVQIIANACLRNLKRQRAFAQNEIQLVRGYAEPGYGLVNSGMIEAVKRLAVLEGLFVDPVYSGKALAALFEMVRSGEIGQDETVVFIHTGGTPALFAYADIF